MLVSWNVKGDTYFCQNLPSLYSCQPAHSNTASQTQYAPKTLMAVFPCRLQKGPICAKYYLHVIIDQYSKYLEVDILKSTFSNLEPHLDRNFSSYGIQESLSTDNGSSYFSHDMSEYAKHQGIKHIPIIPEVPQFKGFAENFVKFLL